MFRSSRSSGKNCLKKAEEFYSNYLPKQDNNNQALRREAALAHSKLGDINRLLENHEDAVEQYKDAIDGFEKLSKDDPASPAHRQALAYAHNWLGETLRVWLEEAHPPYGTPTQTPRRNTTAPCTGSKLFTAKTRRTASTSRNWPEPTITAAFFATTMVT